MITCATEKLVMEEDVEFAKFKQNPRRSALSEICSRYQAQVLDFALKRLEVTGVLLLFVYSAKCYFPDVSFLS